MSVGTDRVFNISNLHSIASPSREGNTDWPRNSILCTHLSLVSERAFVTFKHIRQSRAS